MDPVDKALWQIEHRFLGELTLDMIAEAAGVSKYHLVRAFGLATGMPVMRYVRGRRLSEAARMLAAGENEILPVALDAGYQSHEAFTRAFRDQFGVTPDQIRKARSTDAIRLLEPTRMTPQSSVTLDEPQYMNGAGFTVAGLKQSYSAGQMAGIPSQWQKFATYIGHIDGAVPGVSYGVICNGDDDGNIDYMTGMAVTDTSSLPAEFDTVVIAPQRYAIFTHKGHVTSIGATWMAIFNEALPATGKRMVRAPQFERVGDEFDPDTGNGEIQIWIPVERD